MIEEDERELMEEEDDDRWKWRTREENKRRRVEDEEQQGGSTPVTPTTTMQPGRPSAPHTHQPRGLSRTTSGANKWVRQPATHGCWWLRCPMGAASHGGKESRQPMRRWRRW